MKHSTLKIVGALLVVLLAVVLLVRSGEGDNQEAQETGFIDRERPEILRPAKVSDRKDREPIKITMSGFRSAWGEDENQ